MEWLMNGRHVYVGILSILISTAIHLALLRERNWHVAVELLLMYSIGITGSRGIFRGFVMHFFFADQVATSIGWEAGSPFQMEVAFANLVVGVLGACGFWLRDFWLPYLIVSSIFAWGAGFTHLLDMLRAHNYAPNNAGPILYADFLLPVARIILYCLYRRGSIGSRAVAQPI